MLDDQQEPRFFIPPDSPDESGPNSPQDMPDSTEAGPLQAPQLAEEPPAEEPAPPAPEAYASDLRKSLMNQEEEATSRTTSGLFRRITGSLRRVTAPLRGTGKLRGETRETDTENQPSTEIGDDFLSGRLGDPAGTEPAPGEITAQVESEEEEIIPVGPDIPLFDSEDYGTPGAEEDNWLDVETKPDLSGDEPISLLESGAIAAQDEEEVTRLSDESDWMAQIRAETAREEGTETQPGREKSSPRSASGPLLDFINSILRRPESKQEHASETASEPEAEIPEELLTDRLAGFDSSEVSGQEAVQAAFPSEEVDLDAHLSSLFGKDDSQDEVDTFPEGAQALPLESEASTGGEEDSLFDSLEARFGLVDQAEVGEPSLDTTEEEVNPYRLFPEDEKLLWGEAPTAPGEETPLAPDSPWGTEPEITPYVPDVPQVPDLPPIELQPSDLESPNLSTSQLTQEVWGESAEQQPPMKTPTDRLSKEDAYAAAYLTGEDYVPIDESGPAQDYLLREVLEKSGQKDDILSLEDMRAIVLEDYQEGENPPAWKAPQRQELPSAAWEEKAEQPGTTLDAEEGDSTLASRTAQAASLAEEARIRDEEDLSEPALLVDWRAWLAYRSPFQRILLAEAAVVVLVMLVAVPYFLFLIARGPVQSPGAVLSPRALPADLPHPTALTLPGGWDFPLEKSTFISGQWRPVTSEWLEGSELRRVVALPWNPQTEAVIQTFKVGDRVELILNNGDTLRYKVTEIKRVPVEDSQIYYDRKPSLAVILYQEKAKQRWVVICKP